jgi:hypothetical protein
MGKADELRQNLVSVALEWEQYFGVGPNITSVISEWDAAKLVGMNESEYCKEAKNARLSLKVLIFSTTKFVIKSPPIVLAGRKDQR